MAGDLHLVGIRVSSETQATFEAAAAGYGRSLQDLLRPLLEAEAERLRQVPEIATILRAAAELRARESGKLQRLGKVTPDAAG
jgi:hypothetical protein